MKVYGFICCLGLLLVFNGCSTENENEARDKVNGIWNLVSVSGGFAGIDDDFEKGVIIWKFDAKGNTLIITNNTDANSIYNGLATGSYAYSVLQEKDKCYLLVNGKEIGGIIGAGTKMVLDQNINTAGSGADGFVFVLER